MKSKLFSITFLIPFLLTACITTDPKESRERIEQTIHGKINWSESSEEAMAIREKVDKMLQQPMSLSMALEITLLQNPELQESYEKIGIAQAELAQASRISNPGLSISGKLGNSNPKIEMSITQSITDLIFLSLKKKIAANNLSATELGLEKKIRDMLYEVSSTYYEIQAEQQLLHIQKTVSEAAQGSIETTRRLHTAGNISDLDLATEEAEYQKIRLELHKSERQIIFVREKLNRLLGLWGKNALWTITTTLPPLPESEGDFTRLENWAIEKRADMKMALKTLEITRLTLERSGRVRWLPMVSIGANAEKENSGELILGPSLSFDLPIFDSGDAQLAELNAHYRQSIKAAQKIAVDIRSEVRMAREEVMRLRQAVNFYLKVYIPERIKITELTQVYYNAMLKGVFHLLLAKNNELRAEKEYIEVLRDYWIAVANLEKAVGNKI